VRNINTKIALSALSAVAATLLIGAGTYAYFSDIATSSSNAFSSGVLNLQLDDISEGISELHPAQTTHSVPVPLICNLTIQVNHLPMGFLQHSQ